MASKNAWLGRLRALQEASGLVRYCLAAGLIATIVLVRAAFDDALAPGVYYYLYYPAIVIIAYGLGLGPALLAAAMAGFLPYYIFAEPTFQLKTELRPNVRLALFLLISGAIAALMADIRRRLGSLTEQIAQTSALTRNQAELFREHAERVGDHLQLLSAILQFKAHGEQEPAYSRVLMNAASRTLLISRLHRSFVSSDPEKIDFLAFAQRLADAALEAHGRAPLVIRIEGRLQLLPEQATSLALMLLECINARVAQNPRGMMTIQLSEGAGEGALTISQEGQVSERAGAQDMQLIGAIAEQMQGRLVIGASGERDVLRFAFPTDLQPLPNWDPLVPLN